MNWAIVRILWKHEMRMILRDRRTIVLAILLPVAAMPLLLFGSRIMQERRARTLEGTVYRYAVDPAGADSLRAWLERARLQIEAANPGEPSDSAAVRLASYRFEEVWTGARLDRELGDTPPSALASDSVHVYLQWLSGAAADSLEQARDRSSEGEGAEANDAGGKQGRAGEDETAGPGDGGREGEGSGEAPPSRLGVERRLNGVPLVNILFRGNRDVSSAGAARLREYLAAAASGGRERLLRERGFAGDPGGIVQVSSVNIAPPGQVAGSRFGRLLTLYVVLFLFSGAAVVATDLIAGEKERGSLETILTTAVGRREITAAKQLSIITVGLATTLAQAASVLVFVRLRVADVPGMAGLDLEPASVFVLLLLFLPVAALVSSILLATSAYARSYKEAQLLYLPVLLVSMVPPLAAAVPTITLRSAIALVPVANVSVAVRDILSGTLDWPMLAVVFLATTAAALLTLRQTARLLQEERLVAGTDSVSLEERAEEEDGGSGGARPRSRFSRHVLAWYAVMAAVMFSVALNVPELGSFRRQLLFNQALFVGSAILMTRVYHLRFTEAFALRRFDWRVLPGIVLLVPSALVTGTGLFRFLDLFIPVPEEMLRQLSRTIMPAEMPVWQLILFVSLIPGVCEELTFRGPLLHGLSRRYRPAAVAIVTGLVFGLFHVSLFRIATTAFLGVVLTTVALLTGSVFPCMLVHIGNNALALWLGMSNRNMSALPWWAYLAAVLGLAAGLTIIYRYRTPYPGLRPNRRRSEG